MTATTIVVDALSVHMGGGLSFLSRQLEALAAIAPDRELRVLAAPWNRTAIESSIGIRPDVALLGGLPTRVAYEQLVLPRRHDPSGVLYCPGNLVPLWRCALPTVLVLQNPNLVGAGALHSHNQTPRRRLQILAARLSARRADRVIVISESLRDEVLEAGLVDKDRLRVVPSGCPDLTGRDMAVEPDGFPFDAKEFLLVLANDAPHKRHDDMVLGWARAFDGTDSGPGLVVAGRMSEARRAAQRALVPPARRSQLVHLGAIEQRAQVAWLLRNAVALVALSALEAHPLTPAEAGLFGCPLLLSDIAAHREVAGDNATYVPVGDIDGLAAQLRAAVAEGRTRVPWRWPVTWQDNAQQLLDIFDELVPDEPLPYAPVPYAPVPYAPVPYAPVPRDPAPDERPR